MNRIHVFDTGATMSNEKDNYMIVGIGASAGGLEALRQTLPSLPTDAGLIFVIIQHMDSNHQSMLVTLLESYTEMQIIECKNDQHLKQNHVYVTPPGTDIVFENDKLVLHQPEAQIGPRPSIDRLFVSLANEKKERCAGIVLSGTGSDGAHGLRAIKAAGGITFAQLPSTAKYDGMPNAGIRTGIVDLILAPDAIGTELALIAKNALLLTESRLPKNDDESDIADLIAMLAQKSGLDFSEYKENTLTRRIKRRLAVLKLRNIDDYIEYLKNAPNEAEEFKRDLLISVTSFFRDQEAFDALKEVMSSLNIGRRNQQPFRIWIPGCSTGEEAYSLVILLTEHLGDKIDDVNMQVFATDVDEEVIRIARKGEYPSASLENVKNELVSKYFSADNGSYRVVKAVRERIVFAKQNIIADPSLSRLDLIACRNLLIYFKAGLQSRLLKMFHYALNPNGVLFLGKSESVSLCSNLFTPLSKKWRIFKRESSKQEYIPNSRFEALSPASNKTPKFAPPRPQRSLRDEINDAIATHLGPSAVLVNNNHELLYARGDTSRFFQIGEGSIGLSALDLVKPEIRTLLRTALAKAQREGCSFVSERNRVNNKGGGIVLISIGVYPVDKDNATNSHLLITFQEEEISHTLPDKRETLQEDFPDQQILELEQELAAAYERLQATIEELETSNEELQSLNEELQSANEELQSTNEELETSNEELQATNEELSTVNEELEVKSAELAEANSNLENVFRRMEIPLIVVDTEMRVKRFTPAVQPLFNLMPGDRGEVVTHLGSQISIPDFKQLLSKAIENGETTTLPVNSETRTYECKIFPHLEEDVTISGALVTFYDMTAVNKRKQEFEALAENAPDIVVRFDPQLRHLYVNKSIEKYTGRKKEAFIGKTNRELGMPSELCRIWEKGIGKSITTLQENVFEFDFPTVHGTAFFEARVVPELAANGNVTSLLILSRDITPLKQKILELDDTLASISDGFFALDAQMRVTYFNKAAGNMLQRDPSEVLGHKLFDVFPEAAGSVFEENYRAALYHKKNQFFETFFENAPYTDWYSVRVFPKENGISVYFRVITEQKQAEEQIERHKNLLESIINNVPVMITVYNQDTKFIHVNKAFEDLTGWRQEELGRIDLVKACYPDPQTRKAALDYMKQASSEWKPFELTTKMGKVLDTIWSNVLMADGSQIGIGLDVTTKKRIEDNLQKRQRLESLGTLAGGIAHDFNNILSIVIGNIELAHDDIPADSPAGQKLAKTIGAAERAAKLVQQILTFSGKRQSEIKTYPLETILEEDLDFMRAVVPTTVNITKDISPNCGAIRVDRTQFHQVISNVMTNAFQALKNERGEITVAASQTVIDENEAQKIPDIAPGTFVKISVRDTGCGIDKEILCHIFDPFFTTREIGKGSGMGLAVVHGIVQRAGGFIRVDSAINQGSTVDIYFPATNPSCHPPTDANIPVPDHSGNNERILFVDDEEMIVTMNSAILRKHGYEFVGETDSEKALALFHSNPRNFDLVITDQTMPHLSGADFAKRLKELRPDIPIILCTGHSTAVTEENSKDSGIDCYLMKPLKRDELLKAIRAVLTKCACLSDE